MIKTAITLPFCVKNLAGEIKAMESAVRLERLYVKDSVAFSEVCITPSNGFNIFSGVSGSGKSVLMESILAIFGLKDSNAGIIEASFENLALPQDFEADSESVMKIIKKDKARYFLNAQSCSKKRTKEIFGDCVKYITAHSVNELQEQNLLSVLDGLVEDKSYENLLQTFKQNFESLLYKQNELAILIKEEENVAQLRELVAYEIAQIESVNPKVGEYEELLEIKKSLSKKEKILEKIASIKPHIDSFGSILAFLDSLDKGKEIYNEILSEIESVVVDEEERLENLSQDSIEEILNRLENLSNLVHKYGSIEATLSTLSQKRLDLERYNNLSFNKTTLQKELETLSDSTQKMAEEISSIRIKTLEIFSQNLAKYCEKLKLNSPKISLTRKVMSASGIDKVEISLKDSSIDTLSSGEFNRLKLAIMCIGADSTQNCGILILDEIDANLSGSESEGVAEILSILSKKYQIFAISHQSYMPSFANHHYLITKADNGSKITLLDKQGRIQEIARMISGANITDKALNFAKEKLAHLK